MNENEILPENILALNFGLYEPYGIEMIGSANYDTEDDDWACDEILYKGKMPSHLGIDDTYEWEFVLENGNYFEELLLN